MEKVSILITAIAAILAAVLGAFFNKWLNRSKIWLTITSVDRDDTILIDLSPKILKLVDDCHYRLGSIDSPQVPLHAVISAYSNSSVILKRIKEALEKLNNFDKKLDEGFSSDEDKKQDISLLLSDNLILQIIEAKTSNGSLPLPDNIDIKGDFKPLLLSDEFTKPEFSQKGLILYGKGTSFRINLGNGLIGNVILKRTRILNQILQYFITNHLKTIIKSIMDEMQADVHVIYDLNEHLKNLIHSTRLKINVKISNIGGTPANVEPFGILKINSAGKPIKPVLISVQDYRIYEAGVDDLPKMMQIMEDIAKKHGISSIRTPSSMKNIPEYIVIKPGDLVDVEMTSIDPIEDNSIISALESGILSSQVILKRADKYYRNTIKSEYQTMGLKISSEKRKELESIASK